MSTRTNRNLTQSTYNRLLRHVADRTRPAAIDVQDLLRAYEDAVTLLDECVEDSGLSPLLDAEVAEFLYLCSGEPRVELLDEPE